MEMAARRQALRLAARALEQRLNADAHAIFGATSPEAKPWAMARCMELDDGKLRAIISALRPHLGSSTEATKCANYMIRNRMRYPKFHAQGLCTSSGVLEAGCKVVIGTRLKRAGMHWSVSGDNAIIALRCAKLSGRFDGNVGQRRLRLPRDLTSKI